MSYYIFPLSFSWGPCFASVKHMPCFPMVQWNLPANAEDARDTSSILGSGRSPVVGNGNLLQYSCLENSMDRGTWQLRSMGL